MGQILKSSHRKLAAIIFTDIVGYTAMMAKDEQQGLALLDAAVKQGEFIPTNQEYLRFIYDDAAFAPILARQQANQARERDKVLSVVCLDNPYADVWVPMESTCSGYVEPSVN